MQCLLTHYCYLYLLTSFWYVFVGCFICCCQRIGIHNHLHFHDKLNYSLDNSIALVGFTTMAFFSSNFSLIEEITISFLSAKRFKFGRFFYITIYNLFIFIFIAIPYVCSNADRWLRAVSASQAKFFLISLGLLCKLHLRPSFNTNFVFSVIHPLWWKWISSRSFFFASLLFLTLEQQQQQRKKQQQ
jgi:hypothetical protein